MILAVPYLSISSPRWRVAAGTNWGWYRHWDWRQGERCQDQIICLFSDIFLQMVVTSPNAATSDVSTCGWLDWLTERRLKILRLSDGNVSITRSEAFIDIRNFNFRLALQHSNLGYVRYRKHRLVPTSHELFHRCRLFLKGLIRSIGQR